MSARREWYVYYRVAEPTWRQAAQAAMAWQSELCSVHAGLQARVLRRPEPRDGVTLMEIYSGALDAACEADLVHGAPGLQPWLIGERHVECFEALD